MTTDEGKTEATKAEDEAAKGGKVSENDDEKLLADKIDNGPKGGDRAILVDLANERKLRKAAEDKALKLERASLSELERLRAEHKDATDARDKLIKDNLRMQVGIEAGLPTAMIKRLQGDTLEEMKQDAEDLKSSLKPEDKLDSRGRKIPNDGKRTTDEKGKLNMNELIRLAAKG